jgi:hypothetical protein
MAEPLSADDLKTYWAAETDVRKLVDRCMTRFQWHIDLLKRSGRLGAMRSVLSAYYGNGTDGRRDSSQLVDTGDDGETVEMHINQVKPIINNELSLIAGTRPNVKAVATNTDSDSLAQTRLAQQLHEYYDRRTNSQTRELDTVRGGLLASSWTLGQAWQPRDGREWMIGPDGQPLYEGDISIFVLPPWRCAWDFAAQDDAARKWVLFRRPLPRFDTAIQFKDTDPEKYEKLLKQQDANSFGSAKGAASIDNLRNLDTLLGEHMPQEDVLWCWELRHLPTPALPEGRLVRFVEPDIEIWDSTGNKYPYPDDELHAYEFCPERVVVGAGGHTSAFDLCGMQEFLDICTASVATQVNVNGQMRFWSGGETGTQVRSLGMNGAVVETSQKPESLDFPALKPEVLQVCDWILEQMRQSAALNNTVMGQPDKGMPASAQALQRAQAVQYHAVSQAEYVRLVSRNANGKLKMLKRFARAPRRLEAIAGRARTYEIQEWSAEKISGVEAFDVEPINPASASFEARQAFADAAVARGEMSMEDSLAFQQTGSLEQGFDTKRQRKELVESNVTLLQKGVGPPPVDMQAMQPLIQQHLIAVSQAAATGSPPPPDPSPVFMDPPPGPDGQPTQVLRILKSDPHDLAIPAYLGVLSSPASRGDAKLMKAATEAIQLSAQFWKSLTPDECAMYGIPPLPSSMTPPPPVMPPPPGNGAPPGSSHEPKDPTASGGPKLPAPPEDPLTGNHEDAGATGLPQ